MNNVVIKGAGLRMVVSFPPVDGLSFELLIRANRITVRYYTNSKDIKHTVDISKAIKINSNTYHVPIDTSDLAPGMITMEVEAFILDSGFDRNLRKEISRCSSGVLVNE